MFYRQINGVNIIHYNPTPLEKIQTRIEAMRIKEEMEKKQKEKKCSKEQKERIKKIWQGVVKSFNN